MKLKSVLVIIIGVIIYVAGVYGLLKYLAFSGAIGTEDVWTKFKQFGVVGLIIIGVCGSVAWILIKYVFSGKKSKVEIQTPKQPVDTDVSKQLFLQAFIKNTKIPYYTMNEDGKDVVKPCNPDDIRICNEKTFFDRETGSQFQRLEIEARVGTKNGVNVAIIETDKGEAHINKNWNFWIKEHVSMDNVKLERDYPICSLEDNNQRLEMFKYRMYEEMGADPKDLAYIDSLKARQQVNPNPIKSDEDKPNNDLDSEKKRLDNVEKRMRIERLTKEMRDEG